MRAIACRPWFSPMTTGWCDRPAYAHKGENQRKGPFRIIVPWGSVRPWPIPSLGPTDPWDSTRFLAVFALNPAGRAGTAVHRPHAVRTTDQCHTREPISAQRGTKWEPSSYFMKAPVVNPLPRFDARSTAGLGFGERLDRWGSDGPACGCDAGDERGQGGHGEYGAVHRPFEG